MLYKLWTTKWRDLVVKSLFGGKEVSAEPFTPYLGPAGLKEKKLPSYVGVQYLYQPCELEGDYCSANDPVLSLEVDRIGRPVTRSGEPVLYHLQDGLRNFTREELFVVPHDT